MAHVALVTGGTRGIGEAISVALKEAGCKVAANYAGNDERAREFTQRTGIPAFNLFTIPGLGPFSAWLVVFFVGLGLLLNADMIEGVEALNVLVNVLSYTRLAAVLLAKAGMAFVVNLLFFGVYVTGGEGHAPETWHFAIGHMPEVGTSVHGHEVTSIMFGGLSHGGALFFLVGLLILVVGHGLVLALGITSAGLQAVRLEYVEFFGKFFEGGGRPYVPFGYDREYTTGD